MSIASRVFRVNFEIENIGERVAASKKRITWRFVFKGSEAVHSISLEHSRMSAKKRVKLDGVQVCRQEKFVSGEWTYEFSFDEHPDVSFILRILEVKKAKNLNDMYHIVVDGKDWNDLTDRDIHDLKKDASASKWGSDSYARKIAFFKEQIEENEVRITWIFTFGLDGDIHKLILDHCDDGEKHLILNRREIHRTAQYTEEEWKFSHTMVNGHVITVTIRPNDVFELTLNGSAWADIAETQYTLQQSWEPVHSKSTGKVYYRNDTTKETQWTKPLIEKAKVPAELNASASVDSGSVDNLLQTATQSTPTSLLEEQKQLEEEEEEEKPPVVGDLISTDILPPPPTVTDDSKPVFDPFQ